MNKAIVTNPPAALPRIFPAPLEQIKSWYDGSVPAKMIRTAPAGRCDFWLWRRSGLTREVMPRADVLGELLPRKLQK